MRKLTDQQKIDLVQRYINGESSVKLASEYNIARQSVLSILKIRKIEIRHGK